MLLTTYGLGPGMLVGVATQNLAQPYRTTNKANTCFTQMTNVRLLSAQRSIKDKKRETIDRARLEEDLATFGFHFY